MSFVGQSLFHFSALMIFLAEMNSSTKHVAFIYSWMDAHSIEMNVETFAVSVCECRSCDALVFGIWTG